MLMISIIFFMNLKDHRMEFYRKSLNDWYIKIVSLIMRTK